MDSKEPVNETSGQTKDEEDVCDTLLEALSKYRELERQHPTELSEFVSHIHALQGLLGMRILRRCYPKGWPTYKLDDEGRILNG